MVGGFVDAIGFLVVGSFISSMTGNTALGGARLAEWHWANAWFCFFLVATFLGGATVSGIITEGGRRLGYQSVYAMGLVVEAILLTMFLLCHVVLGQVSPLLAGGLLCAAMGLQNATITQIAGAVVRTTHVTGVVTDFGIESVQFLYWFRDRTRGRFGNRLKRAFRLSPRHPSLQRLMLLASIWTSFTLGVVLGAIAWQHLHSNALIVPIGFLCYMIILDALRPISVVRRLDKGRINDDLTRFGIDPATLPPTVSVYHVECRRGRESIRPPDLSQLHRQLGRQTRVMVLLLPPEMRLDDNGLLGLQQACEEIRKSRRQLVVCAPQPELFLQLRDGPVARVLGEPNICHDPEFAVARAIEIADGER